MGKALLGEALQSFSARNTSRRSLDARKVAELKSAIDDVEKRIDGFFAFLEGFPEDEVNVFYQHWITQRDLQCTALKDDFLLGSFIEMVNDQNLAQKFSREERHAYACAFHALRFFSSQENTRKFGVFFQRVLEYRDEN